MRNRCIYEPEMVDVLEHLREFQSQLLLLVDLLETHHYTDIGGGGGGGGGGGEKEGGTCAVSIHTYE